MSKKQKYPENSYVGEDGVGIFQVVDVRNGKVIVIDPDWDVDAPFSILSTSVLTDEAWELFRALEAGG